MKKATLILSIAILVVLQLCFPCISVNAETGVPVNTNVDFEYIKIAPKIDGIVKLSEYGKKVHSVDYSNKEFLSAYDKDKSIKADFYAAWDLECLYLAWVVNTDIHNAINGYDIWKACCIQFQLTQKNPEDGVSKYLEVGIAVTEDNAKFQYCIPNGATLTLDDWDFVGTRDDKKNTTTYEVKLPFDKLGITGVGDGKIIGMSYALGDQLEFKDTDVATQNMCEWQDCVLGTKTPSNCAVVTLKGGDKPTESEVSYPIESFDPPSDDDEILTVSHVNGMINNEQATVITDPSLIDTCNLLYTMNVALAPTDEKYVYKVDASPVETNGNNPNLDFPENELIIAFHGDTPDNAAGKLKALAGTLNVGDTLTFRGFNFEGGVRDKDSYILIERTGEPAESNESEDETSAESLSPDNSDESISNVSKTSSSTDKNNISDNESEVENSEDNNTWIIIGIIIIAIIIIGVVTFIVIKRNKNK